MDPAGGQAPLLEFDSDRAALLEPEESALYWASALDLPAVGPEVSPSSAGSTLQGTGCAPVAAVACFFPEMVARLQGCGRPLLQLPSGQPLWEVEHGGQRLAVFYPGMGAALASYSLELAIAVGCRSIIACGGAGAIQASLSMGRHVVTVTSAIRDEGASYHYLPPSQDVQADPEVAQLVSAVVARRDLPHVAGKTWTTDGIFRETPSRVARRRSQGCLTVEMEASALIAVATFRGVRFGQLLYAGDDLSGERWQSRDWKEATEVRELLIDLAADSALLVADRLGPVGAA